MKPKFNYRLTEKQAQDAISLGHSLMGQKSWAINKKQRLKNLMDGQKAKKHGTSTKTI